jgi:hypothetical protein
MGSISWLDSIDFNTSRSYIYDKQGKLVEMTRYDADRWPAGTITYKYDEKGRLVQAVASKFSYLLRPGDLKLSYNYGKNDKLSDIYGSWASGAVNSHYQLAFDARGNLVKLVQLDSSGGELDSRIASYDSKGLLTEIRIKSTGLTIRFKYTAYDSYGNWTQRQNTYIPKNSLKSTTSTTQRIFVYSKAAN